jgi:hypothetical protein
VRKTCQYTKRDFKLEDGHWTWDYCGLPAVGEIAMNSDGTDIKPVCAKHYDLLTHLDKSLNENRQNRLMEGQNA